MSSKSKIEGFVRLLAGIVALGATLGGCSDIYFDRRETVSLGAKDAILTDQVTQVVDPWPRQSGNRNIAFNGERMQAAAERYRTGKVIPPVNATTTSIAQSQAQQAAAGAAGATTQTTTTTTPAAPVR